MNRTVAIIGAGNVGTSTAVTLALQGSAEKIILLDRKLDKAQGEIMDLDHASAFLPAVELVATDNYQDITGANIVIITAGAAQQPGESRLDLLKKNASILKSIITETITYAPDCIIIVVTNPVDVLTYLAQHYSGFPKHRVIGTGTVLDTARFRDYLGKQFKVHPHNIHAYILGEHGDSSFPVLSTADLASIPLATLSQYNSVQLQDLHKQVVQAAYDIIQKKGATNLAIAICVNQIVRAILNNTHEVFPISSVLDGEYGIHNVAISTPSVLGHTGIEQELVIPLNSKETAALQQSVAVLKQAIASVS
jgi:L-lactate dehydrogenase